MLNIIITGHGNFASGLSSSIELIAGKQTGLKAIDFEEGMSSESLNKELRNAIEELNQDDGVVLFTDIPGGTPFNQSVLLVSEFPKMRALSGTNLPALLDGIFSRSESLDCFVDKVLDAGKKGLVTYETKKKNL